MIFKVQLSLAKFLAQQTRTRHKRRIHPDHPTQKMDTDEIMTFRRKNHTDCSLRWKLFTVKKTSQPAGVGKSVDDRFIFYAVAGRFWQNELKNSSGYRRYENQIGFIVCGPGWIELLEVFYNARLRGDSFDTWRNVNAQNCGVGVVLAELCLLDPYIFERDEHNQAKQHLDAAGLTIHESCKRLVGLTMASSRPGGGLVYFSSGIRMGYRKILIFQECEIGDLEYDQYSYNTYDTQVARDNYVYELLSGNIRACAGYERCEAWLKNWYLCDDSS